MSGILPYEPNDTRVHVAQLLQEQVGAVRQRPIALEELPLDEGLTARDVTGSTRLTRIPTGILVKGSLSATVELECIRCLEPFEQPVEVEFADEYRPTIDIATGAELTPSPVEADDEYFSISDLHLLDLRESLRQALVLELPMAPLCREDCPGLPEAAGLSNEVDDRLAVLSRLLVNGDDDASE
jgi:DUF177 domain-containing protein